MEQNEIIEMAISNGFYKNDEGTITSPFIEDVDISELLLGFAEDVAAKEREACIQIVENEAYQYSSPVWAFEIVNAIKDRDEKNESKSSF